ncbi:hypothetical protein [Pseudomonas sp. AU8050]|uniref:hypothetical protein n=1 Tax=Pseudomonas sp. AU8050 TaxID=2681497 RepID=UPI00140BE7AC|nr:hypothetical protein [Pseudomonas sp. AU8050]NHC51492.1 hypothetical protein [Pseudomonas sp. AU8050]
MEVKIVTQKAVTGGWLVLTAALLSGTVFAAGGDQSVDNAFTLCRMLDSTNMLSEPCDVSGWGSSVDISVDMTAQEARKLCPSIKNMLTKNNMTFDKRWTMKVKSPYSGDKAIATCQL